MIRLLALRFALVALVLAPAARAEIDVIEVTSEGGITAWLVEAPAIPILSIDAYFVGGPAVEPAEKSGATNLMMALLEEGAGALDAVGFAEARETLAARFSFDTSRDGVSVSATMLTENRDASIALLADALTKPRFDEAAFRRVQAQVLSSIDSDSTDPQAIAGHTFARLAFGDHPYGRDVQGTRETVMALSPDDLRAAHADSLTRERLFIGVVGDITEAELGPLLDRLFGVLPADGPDMPEAIVPDTDGSITVVPFETPQSVASFGQSSIARDDPDFLEAYVLNHILGGGGFSSRLMEEVREKRGLTYGIGSYLSPGRLGALHRGGVSSANERIAETVEVLKAEWARIARDGVTAEELEKAKRYLTGAYPLRFDGNAKIAGMITGLQAVGLPRDYVKTRNSQIEAITLEEINRVARQIMKPEQLRIVVVGQPVGLSSTN